MSENLYLFEIDGFPNYFVGADLNIYSEKYGYMKRLKGIVGFSGYHGLEFELNRGY